MTELVQLEVTIPFPVSRRQIQLRIEGERLVIEVQRQRCDWCQKLHDKRGRFCGSNCRATHHRKK